MDFRSEEEIKQALKCNREYMGKEPASAWLQGFIHSFIYFVMFLWRIRCVPNTGLDPRDTESVVNQDLGLPEVRVS